jgi:hypothetical protein
MRETRITLPELGLIAGTRAALGEAVIFSELGLILYSDHDLIPCMDSAPWTPRHPSVAQEQRHDTAPV